MAHSDSRVKLIQGTITGAALTIAVLHLVFPSLGIDAIVLTLIAIAILPWVAPLFKSVELPGGIKVEFRELERVADDAKRVGLFSAQPAPETKFAFQVVADEDPNLALAGVRIEIEKRLVKIAEEHGLLGRSNRRSVVQLMRVLSAHDLIEDDQFVVLEDLIGLLNSAVHGAHVDPRASKWAVEVGSRIIQSLDEQLR